MNYYRDEPKNGASRNGIHKARWNCAMRCGAAGFFNEMEEAI